MRSCKAPAALVVICTAMVAGAVAGLVSMANPLAGGVVLLTALTAALVVGLVLAERSQARYRRRLAAKCATRPWFETDVRADEDRLVEARRARLADSLARPAQGAYSDRLGSAWPAPATVATRVVIDHHEPIRESS